MQSSRKVGLIITTVSLLGACVTGPPAEDPVVVKLTELENRLVKAERVVNNQSLIGLQGQLDQLREELRVLRGGTETVQFELKDAGKRQRTQYLDVDARLQKLESGGGGSFVSVAGANSAAASGGDRQAYDAAFELLKNSRYEEAKSAFASFATDYPNSALADNANYWLAEAHYVTGDYQAALAQFQKVTTDFPSSAKIPDALLKIGYCHYELKSFAAARAALEAVASSYPNTTPAQLAQQRLGQLQSEGH